MCTTALPEEYLSVALEILEFTSYFGEQIGCRKLKWCEFEQALLSSACALFHGLHVQLVRLLYYDLPGTQFTCFASTKVKIRTPEELCARR
jgi:hypothetical protein